MIKFAEQLKTYRHDKQLSQDALAEKLYISRQAISKWENGDATPDLDNLIKLADIFSCSLDELILARKKEVQIERVYDNKKYDTKIIIKTFWLIFINIIFAGIFLFFCIFSNKYFFRNIRLYLISKKVYHQ